MEALKRIIGVYLIAVAVIVAVHTIIEPLYYTSTEADPYTPNWGYINPLMAIAVALSLVCSYGCKRRADSEGGDDTVTLVWGFIDAALPPLLGAMGMCVLRCEK